MVQDENVGPRRTFAQLSLQKPAFLLCECVAKHYHAEVARCKRRHRGRGANRNVGMKAGTLEH